MPYNKLFDPTAVRAPGTDGSGTAGGDTRDGSVYAYTKEIVLAVNVAMATSRPLLVSGPPGSGKSSLAASVARWKGWRYYEEVVTSRTQARDLLWRFDAVRRLGDAQTKSNVKINAAYVDPGTLWWAFDRESALRRGVAPDKADGLEPPREPGIARDASQAVVLIDEIDKADPDVPNSLLVALGSLEFRVEETEDEIKATTPPVVIITTNDERELPRAFLRRCVTLSLFGPNRERLLEIARAHFPDGEEQLHVGVVDIIEAIAASPDVGHPPSTAEFIDAIRACQTLDIRPDSSDWEVIVRTALQKKVAAEQAPS